MRLHRNLCEAVVAGLEQILIQGAHAGYAIDTLLGSNKKWGARDRNFIADHIYTLIRYQRLYGYAAGGDYIDTPAEAWHALGAYLIAIGHELPAWPEWAGLDADTVHSRLAAAQQQHTLTASLPDWLDHRGAKELDGRWAAEIAALNAQAPLCIRVNPLRATREAVADFLRSEQVPFTLSLSAPDAIIIDSRRNLRTSYAYRSGWFEVQDVSSQLVAPALDVSAGMTVIDACAGAGGKTMHLAALMHNKGRITAIDIYPDKLRELESRARRNDAKIIRTLLYTDSLEHTLRGTADRLLLDVPCSGMGVLRRHPDTKWKLTSDLLDQYITAQQDILRRYSIMLKPGGIMVYATCSIFPSENEKQVQAFLADHLSFAMIGEQKVSPAETGFDGFYICRLQRTK
ncbi:MAG: methyltransferase domain-containing protein [Bacteroidetes bacterium]|nr:methyltransferase domain-containing protein [Bacteroidota bacterium]